MKGQMGDLETKLRLWHEPEILQQKASNSIAAFKMELENAHKWNCRAWDLKQNRGDA